MRLLASERISRSAVEPAFLSDRTTARLSGMGWNAAMAILFQLALMATLTPPQRTPRTTHVNG